MKKILHIIGVIIGFSLIVIGQDNTLSTQMSNRLEYQLPDNAKADELFTNIFDLSVMNTDFESGLRLNHYQPADNVGAVDTISQRYFQYRSDWLKIRVGNFYKRIGKGLSFHAFEMRDIALDRIKQSFIVDKNVDGILMDATFDKFDMSILSGKLSWLQSTFVKGGECHISPRTWLNVGTNYIKITESASDVINTELISGLTELSLGAFGFYGEYVNKSVPVDFTHKKGNALYLSSNVLLGSFGLSMEYKDYYHFENSYSTPPTLVREHFITLLNRQSHQVYADNETGYQIEAFYSPTWTTSLVLNYSQATSDYGFRKSDYHEIYGEVKQDIADLMSVKLVADQMVDEFTGKNPSRTGALELDYFINDANSVLFDYQYQDVQILVNSFKAGYINRLYLVSYSLSQRFSVTIQQENTSEPFLEKTKWNAVNLNISIGQRHDLNLFYGERRAGKACSGGVCLPLPAFEGFELRLVSRL